MHELYEALETLMESRKKDDDLYAGWPRFQLGLAKGLIPQKLGLPVEEVKEEEVKKSDPEVGVSGNYKMSVTNKDDPFVIKALVCVFFLFRVFSFSLISCHVCVHKSYL